MKRIIITGVLLVSLVSFAPNGKKCKCPKLASIENSIDNLIMMEKWLQEDFDAGDIPIHVANNYMWIIINTKCELSKQYGKKTENCD